MKKTKKPKLTSILYLRCTPAEKERLTEWAASCGMSEALVVRLALDFYMSKRP